jgi:hypothetical protein
MLIWNLEFEFWISTFSIANCNCQAVEMDEYWSDDLKSKLIKPLRLVKILKWTVLGIGCLLIGVAAAVFLVTMRKSKDYV